MEGNVHLETKENVAVITIDRPKALNALNQGVMGQLVERVEQARDQGARCLVITGGGEKAFVAGADIAEMQDMDAQAGRAHSVAGHEVLRILETLDVPIIAAVNGFALGGGLELALACDIRIASENAQFGLPEVTLGVIPGFGGTQRLSRMIGLGPALDLVLSGRRIKAEEALRMGLVSQVVPQGELMPTVLERGQQIAANGPVAVKLAKRAVRRGFDGSLATGDALETEAFGACFATEDQKEGMKAFVEKRKPAFQGK